MALAAAAGTRLILATPDTIDALAELDAKPPLLINGPYGCWEAVLRLHRVPSQLLCCGVRT
jgi:hypothetical protein